MATPSSPMQRAEPHRGAGTGAVCLAGPTASGKTAVALALAQRLTREGLSLEIISVDSALVYRGMDIGTAKPSAAERAAVPHHLIDLLDPLQAYSAARFAADSQAAIIDIRRRGALPLLVGGTMLYFKALREGLHPLPGADAAVRAQIDLEAAAQGWPALHAELARVDPHTAARLAPADSQRIQRALEVWRSSGRTLSNWHSSHVPALDHAASAIDTWPLLSLEPQSRLWLHQRIEQRLDLMFQHGFVDEVQRLRQRGDLHLGLPSMRCVGYRQVWQALDAIDARAGTALNLPVHLRAHHPTQNPAHHAAHHAAHHPWRETTLAATRQLAKRQLTWLRSMTHRHVMACDDMDPTQSRTTLEPAVQWLYRRLLDHEADIMQMAQQTTDASA